MKRLVLVAAGLSIGVIFAWSQFPSVPPNAIPQRAFRPGDRVGIDGPGGPFPPPMEDPVFMALDQDADGGISPEEIKGSPSILRSLDENQDGILQFEELRPNIPPFILDRMRERPSDEEPPDQQDMPQDQRPAGPGGFGGFGGPGGPMGGFQPPVDPLLEALDTDKSGEIEAAEIDQAPQSLLALDSGGDGALSEDEFRPAFARRGPGGFGGPGGPMGGEREIVDEYDEDGDGRLNDKERAAAREAMKNEESGRGGRRGGGMPFGPGRRGGENVEVRKGESISPDDVQTYQGYALYDPAIIRTLFLNFPNDDWEAELEDFYRTDVEVPAELIVDGKHYPGVGVHFRGNTSFMMAPTGMKRPLNLSIDYTDEDQDLLGYRTLNLLNAAGDPSFLREYLFYYVSRNYVPALKVNFVKLVINGENWGVYVNSQQFNRDSVEEWFDENDGERWKVPANLSGSSSLIYRGDKIEDYQGSYTLKGKDTDEAWEDLIDMFQKLEETPLEQQEEELSKVLDIDGALWFLALDNILMDDDGYLTRGSDFHLYQEDRNGRFHLISHDNNEGFKMHMMMGGGPGGRGPRGDRGDRGGRMNRRNPQMPADPGAAMDAPAGNRDRQRRLAPQSPDPGADGPPPADDRMPGFFPGPGGMAPPGAGPGGMPGGPGFFPGGMPGEAGGDAGGGWSVMTGVDNPQRPLANRLLANPALKSRYLAHYRTIVEEVFNSATLDPVVEQLQALLRDEMEADVKRTTSIEAFLGQPESPAADSQPQRGGFPGPPGGGNDMTIQEFVKKREAFLKSQPEFEAPVPVITDILVTTPEGEVLRPDEDRTISTAGTVTIAVELEGEAPDSVYLYSARDRYDIFEPVVMEKNDDGRYEAKLEGPRKKGSVYFYIEARGKDGNPSAFAPAQAEFKVFRYKKKI